MSKQDRAWMKFLITVRDGLSILIEELSESDEDTVNQKLLPFVEYDDEISLSLLNYRTQEVPERHGINLCMHPGFTDGQCVIYLRREQWSFFPPRLEKFSVRTEDGQTLVMKITGIQTKQLVTVGRLSTLGRYLRRRLGIEWNEPVTKELLDQYGRSDIAFRKRDGNFYLDFGRPDSKKATQLAMETSIERKKDS